MIAEGALPVLTAGEVMGEGFVVFGQAVAVELLDGDADDAVQGRAALHQDARVGDVVGEGVLEHEGQLGMGCLFVDELERPQLAHAWIALLLRPRRCAPADAWRTRVRSPRRSGWRAWPHRRRRSMRAISTSWMRSGMATSPTLRVSSARPRSTRSTPSSSSEWVSSSMKRGFPSDFSAMRRPRVSGSCRVASSEPTRSFMFSSDSGWRESRRW